MRLLSSYSRLQKYAFFRMKILKMTLFCNSRSVLNACSRLPVTSCYGFWSRFYLREKPSITTHHVLKLSYFQCRQISCTLSCSQKKSDHSYESNDRILTIPNILSLGRIAAAPFLSYYIINLDFGISTGILIAASVTDFIDGWIARSYKNQASKFGSFLDPLADKTLIISLYGSMAYMQIIPHVLMGLIVFRDVALLLAGVYIRYISIPPPRTMKKYFDHKHSAAQLSPTMISKINTAVQLLTAVVSLYGSATSGIPEQWLIFLWYLAGFTTVTSGVSYIFAKNTYKILKK